MHRFVLLTAAVSLMGGGAWANDAHNRCAQPMRASANVSPADDAVHLNGDGTFKYPYEEWYWNAVLAGGGKTWGLETIVFQFSFPFVLINVVQIALTDITTGEYQNQ
jgi:hypothetical protein